MNKTIAKARKRLRRNKNRGRHMRIIADDAVQRSIAERELQDERNGRLWALTILTALVILVYLVFSTGCANHAVERFCENVRLYQNELIIDNPELTPAQTKAFEKALTDDDALFELAEMLREPLIVANPRLTARQKELWLITLYQALGYSEDEILPFIERYRAIIAKQAQTQGN